MTDERQMFQNNGTNGSGVFNFFYQVLNLTRTYEEGFTDVPPCVLNLTNSYQEGFTDIPPLDNCTSDSESMIELAVDGCHSCYAVHYIALHR